MPLTTFLDNGGANRGLLWLSLSEVGRHVTNVATDDTGGGITQVWTAGTVDVACRIDPIGSDRQGRLTGGAVDERSTHVVTVPATTPINTANRFYIVGRGTFEITALRERTAEWARMVEVVAT